MSAIRIAGRLQLIPFLAVFILLFWLTRNVPFFWDKDILYSRIAHWIMQHPGQYILPVSLDPGYPTVLAWLLAGAWKLLGTTLSVMHLVMLPFTLGVVWQSRNLLRRFLPETQVAPALLLVLADPALLAQTVVFSTDLVMLFFMLMALNAVWDKKSCRLALAVTGLVCSHMRGVTIALAILLYLLILTLKPKSKLKRTPSLTLNLTLKLLPFLPGFLLIALWTWMHYRATGWAGYHPGSPWAGCYERVDFAGFLRNGVIVAWRMLDFGRIFVVAAAAWLMLKQQGNPLRTPPFDRLFLLLILLLLFTLPAMLGYRMLNGHRYLIPVFSLLSVIAVTLLFSARITRKLRNILYGVMLGGMLTGNLWGYPDGVAMGWDATLAHLPWHKVRQEMLAYIEQHHIPFGETGSRTPNTSVFDDTNLNGDPRAFPWADLSTDRYVFYTNISNMFTDEEISELKKNWVVVKEFRILHVKAVLYRK